MSGFQAVQSIVLVFGIIFLVLMTVMVLGRRRSQKQNAQSLKDSESSSSKINSGINLTPLSSSRSSQLPSTSGKQESQNSSLSRSEKERHLKVVTEESMAPLTLLQRDLAPVTVIPTQEEPTSLSKALEGTRTRMWGRLQALWSSNSQPADIDEIEEILYTSDLGPQTVSRLLESIKQNLSRSEKKDSEVVRSALRHEILQMFKKSQGDAEPSQLFEHFNFQKTSIWMMVGVNGAGKTTSIGKIASQLALSGKRVLLAAGDTFRAAAGSQLKVWTERAQVEIFSPEGVTDPSAVAFDAVQRGVAKNYDVVIVDTAGRLHTQHNLMEEIKKMKRVIQKVIPEAPHEVLLVLDSNQGQNALMQAKEFHKALGVTGVVLTKLDGSAKGGVAVGVAHELELPIKLIGVGEKMEDLRSFSPKNFVESIL